MPVFHLHIDDRNGRTDDHEGLDLPDLDEARRRAIAGIRSLICDEILKGRFDLSGRIDITDHGGNLLCRVPFTDAVEVEEGP